MIKKKKFSTPNPFVLLISLVLFAALLTLIIPSGSFERETVEGLMKPLVVPGTYEPMAKDPISLMEIFSAIPQGMTDSGSIIFLILISAGAFTVYNKSGAIESGIGVLLNKIHSSKINPIIALWLVLISFSLLGWVCGPEMTIPFLPIMISIALGLGFDLIVGLAIVLVGGMIGFSFAPINASIIGNSHAILGMPLFSGFGLRFALWAVATVAVCIVISSYAKKISKDPTKSLVYGISTEGMGLSKDANEYKLTKKQIAVLLILLASTVMIIIGTLKFGWYLAEMSAVFLVGGILAGLVCKFKLSEIADYFVKGAASLIGVAFLVGIARAIQIVLETGNIMDTIIYYISEPLSNMDAWVAALAMVIIVSFIHIFITSASGLTVTLIPLLGPIGVLTGLTLQTTILIFQAGATFNGMIMPTMGVTVAMCGMARIPFEKWVRFGIKIVLVLYLVSFIFIYIAMKIGYGPF